MRDEVLAAGEVVDGVAVTDVTLDEGDLPAREGLLEVLTSAADEVVEDVDVGDPGVEELVDDGGADGAGATGDEDVGALQCAHGRVLRTSVWAW